MKFLVLIAVVLLVLWLARGSRASGGKSRSGAPRSGTEPMVRCTQCGLHLPRTEALPGPHGVYCSAAHRSEHERAAGGP